MEVIEYSEKSIVVYGEETRNKVTEIKALGGRFNPKLTHPETKEKFAGWIFSKKKTEQVENLLKGIPQPVVVKSPPTKLVTRAKPQTKKYTTEKLSFEYPGTPEMQDVPSFTMIIPKVGIKIKLDDDEVFEIVETITNKDGLIFEFKAKKENVLLDFYMVGKEWKIMNQKN
jgi:hypothetical protein